MLDLRAQELGAIEHHVVCDDAMDYLGASTERFDIVFLDPPFAKNLLQKACEVLRNKGHLRPGARVYVEDNNEIAVAAPYTILKQARAGKVYYALLESSLGRETQ